MSRDTDRIRQRAVGRRDQHAGDDDAERGDGVAEHVQIGAADVEVVLRPLLQPETDHQVDDDRGRRHRHHHRAVGDLRVTDPVDRFPADEDRDQHQRERVGQRREDADAVIAEGHPFVGRLVGNPERVPAEAEGGGVRQVVSRVGEQRQAVGEPPGTPPRRRRTRGSARRRRPSCGPTGSAVRASGRARESARRDRAPYARSE